MSEYGIISILFLQGVNKVATEAKEVVETASSQSAKVTQLHEPAKKATQSLNSAIATNIYKKTDNEPFFKIINQDGQKILITSNMENPKNAIVTFFNDGKPGKCFECTFEELGSRCGIHI